MNGQNGIAGVGIAGTPGVAQFDASFGNMKNGTGFYVPNLGIST